MLDAAYGYVVRQKPVQLVYKITAVYLGVEIEMCHHLPSVHACVGTPGPHYGYGLAQEYRQSLFHFGLHRIAVGLHLPAMIAAAVITQCDEIAHSVLIFGCKINKMPANKRRLKRKNQVSA